MVRAEARKVDYGRITKEDFYVLSDTQAACPLDMFWSIVQFTVYSCNFFACPIFCNLVVLLEDIAQVMDMPFTNVFNTKIINDLKN